MGQINVALRFGLSGRGFKTELGNLPCNAETLRVKSYQMLQGACHIEGTSCCLSPWKFLEVKVLA